ncbi:Tigger transposable element-derived protein 6 [Dictyocoela muelleri]|nr:Tigger transposable element-derived protein 6 [Dictyocoela muelleri]
MTKKYTRLTYNQKIEIIEYSNLYKHKTCEHLAAYFTQKFNIEISRRTINHFIKNSSNIIENSIINKGTNKAPAKLNYPQLDKNLIEYIEIMESKGAIINDNLIKMKAAFFAKKLELTNFKNSTGFLEKFKKRNGLNLKNLSGETYTSKGVDFSEFISLVKEKVNVYGEKNIYNLDETGIFYKLIPSKSVCKNMRPGYKKFKDRISIMLCANLTGSHKLKPLMIGKYKNPRCFKSFNIENFIEYQYSNKAWMTHIIFNKWLRNFNQVLRSEHRNILILIDNCPSHKITSSLSNIEILFLPKNSTGILQPMDIGIIKCFKTYFNQYKLNSIIEKVENGSDVYESYKEINLRDVALFAEISWKRVSENTIFNCFKHFLICDKNILPIKIENYDDFINKTSIFDPVNHDEFLNTSYHENDEMICNQSENEIGDSVESDIDDMKETNEQKYCNFDSHAKIITKSMFTDSLKNVVKYLQKNIEDKYDFKFLGELTEYNYNKRKPKSGKISDFLIKK